MRIDLKLAILQSGKRQWQVAKEADIDASKLSRFINGYGRLGSEEEVRIKDMLAMPADRTGVAASEGGE